MDPALAAQFASAFIDEWNRMQARAAADGEALQQKLRVVERQISNLVDAIAEGLRQSPMVQAKLDALEAQQIELRVQIDATPAAAPALHPRLAEVYRGRWRALRRPWRPATTRRRGRPLGC